MSTRRNPTERRTPRRVTNVVDGLADAPTADTRRRSNVDD